STTRTLVRPWLSLSIMAMVLTRLDVTFARIAATGPVTWPLLVHFTPPPRRFRRPSAYFRHPPKLMSSAPASIVTSVGGSSPISAEPSSVGTTAAWWAERQSGHFPASAAVTGAPLTV